MNQITDIVTTSAMRYSCNFGWNCCPGSQKYLLTRGGKKALEVAEIPCKQRCACH